MNKKEDLNEFTGTDRYDDSKQSMAVSPEQLENKYGTLTGIKYSGKHRRLSSEFV